MGNMYSILEKDSKRVKLNWTVYLLILPNEPGGNHKHFKMCNMYSILENDSKRVKLYWTIYLLILPNELGGNHKRYRNLQLKDVDATRSEK